MIKLSIVLLLGVLAGCAQTVSLTPIAEMPKKLKENSGLALQDNTSVWTVEDSGNKAAIYKVGMDGTLERTLEVKDAKNHDWEDLAQDPQGNIYIADFGNNGNDRKNLAIYKIHDPEHEKGDKIPSQKIEFSYPEQGHFPPAVNNRLYDAEALFYADGNLYLITKNRARPFTGEALVYTLPSKKGTYKAKKVASFKPCEDDSHACQVTAADISPDGKKIALLGYGRLWIFTDFTLPDFTKGQKQSIDLDMDTQLESVIFENNTTLLLSDEHNPSGGGNLYRYQLP